MPTTIRSQRPKVVYTGLPAPQTDDEGFPIVPAYRLLRDNGTVSQVICWCRYCLRWHLHGPGNGQPGGGNGHRVAHCHSDQSPYTTSKPSGYILHDVGTITQKEMQAYAREPKRVAREAQRQARKGTRP